MINPENIEEYIAVDGYKAIEKVLTYHEAGRSYRRNQDLRSERQRRRGLPDLVQVECCQSRARAMKNTWYVMRTKEIRVHSWTDPFWKATRIPSLEGMIIGGYAMGAISGRDLLPCGVSSCDQETGDRYGSGKRKEASWARTSLAAALISTSTDQGRRRCIRMR